MNRDDILQLPGMPALNPSFPKGPYRFYNREYFIINYESDPEAIRRIVPEPLEPAGGNLVSYEFLRMPDSVGFGDYAESGLVVPCKFKGEDVNFTVAMFLDCEPPISGGREIWGFPKKYGKPKLDIIHDTLTGTLHYAGQLVAMGTMNYKVEALASPHEHKVMKDPEHVKKRLEKTQVNLKLIPRADGKGLEIAQLVAYNMCDTELKGAWAGQARLHLVPHVNAALADLPVKRVIGGGHYIADTTLPYGRVIHDYLKEK
jgi:acetoacetate decarboxylase